MYFGSGGDPELKKCVICGNLVQLADKMMIDRVTLHNKCFNCGYCGNPLKPGECAMEVHSFGRRWYCSGPAGSCAMLPTAQKEARRKTQAAKQ
ncbi:hypothetical protein niasHS_017931 [Heterodera schachtii]|uniref:LIM zinc-binding domain-containing protein n=2 Tax=Heterodera TaxID=34509 RepID=A0ABD2KCZ7_9BILA